MVKRTKKPLNSEKKLELAKTIARKSQSFKKTYESVESSFVKAFRAVSTWIDFVLFNQKFAKLVALCLAVVLYLVINGGTKTSIFVSNVQQVVTLENVKVVKNISESVYEVSDLPEIVTVDVKGDTTDIQLTSQQKDSYQVMADLEVFGEGTHEVKLEPVNFSDKVDVTIQPSTAVVTIKKKISRSFTLGYDYINTDKLDKIYSLSEPEFSQNEIIVRASEDTINQISFVKALISLDGVKADFEQDAPLVAYNQAGEKIAVDILPEKVNVKVKVTTPHKEVPIEIVPEGTMQDNLTIDSYTLDHQSMTLYAPQDVLDDVNKVQIMVPVNKIKANTTITMPVMLPSGVSKGNISKVKISLKVGESTTTEIADVPISYKNYDERFKVVLGDVSAKATVSIKGTKAVVDTIKLEDLMVFMDLEGYTKAGVYDVPLSVSGSNKLANYSLKNKTIKITLEAK